MTEYKRLCAERTAASLQKIIDATQTPSNFKAIALATGLNESGIRTLITRNMQNFIFLGKHATSTSKPMNVYQAVAATANPIILGQAVYRIPYHQLIGEPDYINSQKARAVPFSLIHNARASQKSARVFVSGGTLA